MTAGVAGTRHGGDEAWAASSGRRPTGGIRGYFRGLGPGLVTGASDDDPSGIATYAQAGATYRYGMLWTVLLSFPLMMAVQEICNRSALATGQSLGALTRKKFSRKVRILVGILLVGLLVANTLNIAADLMAIGQGMQLLHAGPAPLWSGTAGVAIAALLVTGSFDLISRVFKWLCLSLLSYVVVVFVVHISWSEAVMSTLIPHLQWSPEYWKLVVAILGTTISPYLFFWQSAHRVEKLRDEDRGGDDAPALNERPAAEAKRTKRHDVFDVVTGMSFSQVVMFAIIAATGATLGAKHVPIRSAADAAKALEPLAGSLSGAVFALGFVGAGFLAVPVLAGAGAAGLSGLLGNDWGFERSPRKTPSGHHRSYSHEHREPRRHHTSRPRRIGQRYRRRPVPCARHAHLK